MAFLSYWASCSYFWLAVLFFSYPDTVDAEFTLTTQAPPAYIIANTAGRIAQLYVKNKQVIYEKDIIGVNTKYRNNRRHILIYGKI